MHVSSRLWSGSRKPRGGEGWSDSSHTGRDQSEVQGSEGEPSLSQSQRRVENNPPWFPQLACSSLCLFGVHSFWLQRLLDTGCWRNSPPRGPKLFVRRHTYSLSGDDARLCNKTRSISQVNGRPMLHTDSCGSWFYIILYTDTDLMFHAAVQTGIVHQLHGYCCFH